MKKRWKIGTPEHARHVIEIMNKAYKAASEGKEISLTTEF